MPAIPMTIGISSNLGPRACVFLCDSYDSSNNRVIYWPCNRVMPDHAIICSIVNKISYLICSIVHIREGDL